MPKPNRFLPFVLLPFLLAGCAGQSAREADAPYIADAESRIRAGDYAGAAEIYRELADTSSAPDYYRMMAADAELRAGNGQLAESLLGEVHSDELVVSEQFRYTLLQSRLYLNQGRAREAMSLLDTLSPEALNVPSRAHYYTLRASAYNQLGNMVESARERIQLGKILRNQEAIEKNNEAIYDALNQLPDQALAGLRPAQPGTLSGWIDLVGALRQPPANRSKAVQSWRVKYAGHPADGPFLDAHLGKGGEKVVDVRPLKPVPEVKTAPLAEPTAPPAPSGPFVGVLLPMSGAFAPAAQAVQSGMTAAQEADANPGKPALRFVDTQGGNPYALYQKLAGEGAQWVVGPLTKEEVSALGSGGELTTPVLALNQSPEVQRDKLYQFALTPEQEVEQSAGSAWFDGKQTALVLAPSSAFGQRVISHFSKYWKSLGGKIAAVKTYKPGATDFTGPVHDLLATVPGGLAPGNGAESSGSAPGADFIFLIADARDGRLLRPQIETQQGTPFPIYATSYVFAGRPDGNTLDQDLNGVIFCDIPWTLNQEGGPLSRQSLSAVVERTPESYLRLVAMGIDAYQLLGQVEQLRAGPQNRYAGATGQLNLQSGNRIQRQLQCAQFDGGVPRPRGVAPLLQPSAAGSVSSPY